MKNKENLIEAIVENLKTLQRDKKLQKELKDSIVKYVLPGDMQEYISSPQETIPNLSIDLLYFIASHLNDVKANSELQVDKYFTKREMKEFETNFELEQEESIQFPYTFKNVIKVDEGDYLTTISAQEIYKLMNNHLIQYNPDTQREGRKLKSRTEDNIVLTVPKTNTRSVRQIAKLLEEGKLIKTLITFNARLGSTDDESGEELYYDDSDLSLTVTEGTLLDVVDGFHRMQGIALALTKNPSLDVSFKLNILNFSKKQAQQYFAQINTYNPVSKARVRELGESNYSDFVTNFIMNEFEDMKDRITHGTIAPKQDVLTTYNIISDAISEEFKMETKADAISVGRYLTSFFKELSYSFPDEFLGNISKIRETSLINMPSIFSGYITLARRMKEENIKIDLVKDIISDINFSKDSPQWIKLGVVKDGKAVLTSKKKYVEFFEKINLEKYREKEGIK